MKQILNSLFVPYGLKFKLYPALVLMQIAVLVAIWLFVPSVDIPTIDEIGAAWSNLASNEGLLLELWVSVKTITISLVLSALIAMLIVYVSTATFFRPSAHFISSLRFLGFAGLTYLFTVWTSGANELKISLLTFGMTVFQVTSMLSEVQSIGQDQIDYAKTLKFKGWRITWEVVVLGKMHTMLDIIRQNAAVGWTLLAMVEGITRSQGGIGSLLINQNRTFNLSAIFAIQLTIMFYGIFQDYVLKFMHDQLCPYSVLAKAK